MFGFTGCLPNWFCVSSDLAVLDPQLKEVPYFLDMVEGFDSVLGIGDTPEGLDPEPSTIWRGGNVAGYAPPGAKPAELDIESAMVATVS